MTTIERPREVDDRLDQLAEQVAFLVAEAEDRRQRRQRWEELGHDAMPVARQAFDSSVKTLDELDVDVADVASFVAQVTESLPTLAALLRQMDSLSELASDLGGLAEPALASLVRVLAEADDRGYISFARSGLGVVDRVVTSYTTEDVEALGENVVLILDNIKEMTQPEVMGMLRRTIDGARVSDGVEPPSTFALLKELRNPDVRRGLSRVISMLRTVGEETHK